MKQLMMVTLMLAGLALVAAGCSKDKAASSGGQKKQSASEGGSAAPAAAPAAPASAPTGEVQVGMTLEQVTKILGEPTSQYATSADGKEILQCVWEKGGTTRSVQFHDGKAAFIHEGTERAAADAGSGARVKQNFSKVKTGMSEAEVVKLLGSPTSSGSAAGGEMSIVVKTWQVGDSTYTVSFMNGKVQMTHRQEGE